MTLRVHPDDIVAAQPTGALAVHPSWKRVRLTSVATVLNGFAFPSSGFGPHGDWPLLRIRDVGRSTTDTRYSGDFDPAYIVEPGSLVVGMDGDFRVDRWSGPPALLNQRVCKVTVRDHGHFDERFLRWVLPGYLDAVHRHTSSVTVKHLSSETVKELPLPLPPRAEQKRIVAAIEEEFSRLDAGVAALESARKKLKRMRAAVLQSMASEALHRCHGLPSRIGSLLDSPLANGRSVPDGPPGSFPVLRLTAVRHGLIDVSCVKAGAWTDQEALPFKVALGDFLVIRGNGSKGLVGRGGLVLTAANVAYPDTLIRMRLDRSAVMPEYVAVLWDSRFVRQQIESAARTTAGIYKINQRDLEHIELPVPPLDEQRALVSRAQAMLSTINATEAVLDDEHRRASALRSSILAAAFSGALVPQDPGDVPASVLLDHMAADRRADNGRIGTAPRRSRAPRRRVSA